MDFAWRIALLFLVTSPLSSTEGERRQRSPVVDNARGAEAFRPEARAHYMAANVPVARAHYMAANVPVARAHYMAANVPVARAHYMAANVPVARRPQVYPNHNPAPHTPPLKPEPGKLQFPPLFPGRPYNREEAPNREMPFRPPPDPRDALFNPFVRFNRPVPAIHFHPSMYRRPDEIPEGLPPRPPHFEHYPYDLYAPEEIYRILPFYEDHPALENYAPARYPPEESHRRKTHATTTSPPRTTGISTTDSLELAANVEPSTNVSDKANQTASAETESAPAVYAVITDEMADSKMKAKHVLDESKDGDEKRVLISPRKPGRPRKHGIPVPFVKVIRFYYLNETDFEKNAEAKQPQYYSPERKEFSATKPKETEAEDSNSANEGAAFAKYMPVYYTLPTISPEEEKAKVRLTD